MEFRDVIKAKRLRMGMSQLEFAHITRVTQTAVSMWERGVMRPHYKTLARLSKVLGVSERDLLYPQDKTEENEDTKNVQ